MGLGFAQCQLRLLVLAVAALPGLLYIPITLISNGDCCCDLVLVSCMVSIDSLNEAASHALETPATSETLN